MTRAAAAICLAVVLLLGIPPARAEITDPWEKLLLNSLCWRGRCVGPEDPGFRAWLERLDPIISPIRSEAGLDHIHVVGLATKVPNAVALMHVMGITVGLTELNPARDEWAFVVAHEVAHMKLNHARQKIQRVQTAQFLRLLNIAFGDPTLDPYIQILAEVALASYSRAQETEADVLGAQLAKRAGFDPCGGVQFFMRLAPLGRANSGDLFDSHPSFQERIEKLRAAYSCGIFAMPAPSGPPVASAPVPASTAAPAPSPQTPTGAPVPQPPAPVPASPRAEADGIVEPGVRAGPIRLGMPREQFLDAVLRLWRGSCMTGPDRTSEAMTRVLPWETLLCQGGPVGGAWFDAGGALVRVVVTRDFATREGIGPGSTQTAVMAAYGYELTRVSLDDGMSLVYKSRGIDFFITRASGDTVAAMGVFRPGVR